MIVLLLSVLAGMKALLAITVGFGLAGALLAWRKRSEPGAVPLIVLLTGQCWWSATLLFRLNATNLAEKIFWVDVSWLGIALIPVAWLWFSLDYTGLSEFVQPKYIIAISIVPGICAVLGATDPLHNLFYTDSMLVETNGQVVLDRTPGAGFWLLAAYTYLLGVLGAIPLLRFISSDVGLFKAQSLLTLVGLFIPWITNVLFLLEVLPTGGVDPTPIAFSISGLAYLGALSRFELFNMSPAPIRPARQSVFRRMQEGAIVLDSNDNIVDINERAVGALDIPPSDILGERINTVIPEFDKIIQEQSESNQPIIHRQGSVYEVSVNQLHDTHGRTTGRIVSLQNITEHHRHQQRLEVLNRVFRHNIRTNIQVIVGNADYLENHNSKQKAAKVREKAVEIEEISEDIRSILDIFELGRQQTDPERLVTVIEDCVRSVREAYPEVTIKVDIESGEVAVDSILQDSLLNLIENAAEHNTDPDPTVRVDVTRDGRKVQIVVADDGPGIDDEELALVKRGEETPLEHGSGFGLALAVWGIDIIGGEITFEDREPSGTIVTATVPVLSKGTATADESDNAVSGTVGVEQS